MCSKGQCGFEFGLHTLIIEGSGGSYKSLCFVSNPVGQNKYLTIQRIPILTKVLSIPCSHYNSKSSWSKISKHTFQSLISYWWLSVWMIYAWWAVAYFQITNPDQLFTNSNFWFPITMTAFQSIFQAASEPPHKHWFSLHAVGCQLWWWAFLFRADDRNGRGGPGQ